MDALRFTALTGGFAAPDERRAAAARVAEALGGTDFILFSPDPERGVLLPAPGLPQTLPEARSWQEFLDQCVERGSLTETLPLPTGERGSVAAITEDGVVAVLVGADAAPDLLEPLRYLLPLLGALFQSERRIAIEEVHPRGVAGTVSLAQAPTRSLDEMRRRLEAALGEAEASRLEARERADHAELLAEELRSQATHLEEQAAELEVLNEELATRTDEAERAREAADQANRTKSEFLANMSHELRTPINAVLGYEELLTMELAGPLTDEQRSHLDRIRSSSRHLLTLISDILDLAKVEAGELSIRPTYDTLDAVLDESVALVQTQYEEREIDLRHGCPDPAPGYFGDRDRVRQILLNLLSNAGKFTGAGGSVTVSCGTTAEPDPLAHLDGATSWIYVHVEDTGIGIAPENLTSVFQPFGQVQHGRTRTHGGTGLGLTISRQLARLMGGDLTVRSVLGVGSCFSLWLPSDRAVEGSVDPSICLPEH